MSYHTDKFKKKATYLLYTVWSLVMVRNQLPAQVVDFIANETRDRN